MVSNWKRVQDIEGLTSVKTASTVKTGADAVTQSVEIASSVLSVQIKKLSVLNGVQDTDISNPNYCWIVQECSVNS